MIDFYYWPTPNGWKIAIMLEETGLEYRTRLTNIGAGDQHSEIFQAISPARKIPAIVDHAPSSAYQQDEPISVFESGAILWYLAEKAECLIPQDALGRKEAMEWVFWQVADLGPMSGQLSHFVNYAEDGQNSYSHQRYFLEVERCLGVLDSRLKHREFILGSDYSIADIAAWPWALVVKPLGVPLEKFPNLMRWREDLKQRPAVQAGINLAKESRPSGRLTKDERTILFGQPDNQ